MAKFLVTFHRGDMTEDPQSIAAARHAIVQWAAKTAHLLVDAGSPIRSAATLTRHGVDAGDLAIPFVGWSVIDAADCCAAIDLLRDHPLVALGAVLQINEPM